MRVLGQDSRLCLLLCSNCFFLAQARLHPFAFVHVCMRVQQATGLPRRGPRAPRTRAAVISVHGEFARVLRAP